MIPQNDNIDAGSEKTMEVVDALLNQLARHPGRVPGSSAADAEAYALEALKVSEFLASEGMPGEVRAHGLDRYANEVLKRLLTG